MIEEEIIIVRLTGIYSLKSNTKETHKREASGNMPITTPATGSGTVSASESSIARILSRVQQWEPVLESVWFDTYCFLQLWAINGKP